MKSGGSRPPPGGVERRARIVLGVDPGTRVLGFAVIEAGRDPEVRECGAIRLRVSEPLPLRLGEIHRTLAEIISRHRPSAVAIEEVFHGKNFQSSIRIGEARGVVLLAAALAGVPVVQYTPATVKKSVTGNGRADKRQVQRMMVRLLNLKEAPRTLDASDALAIAFCHARRLHRPGAPSAEAETPLQAAIRSLKRSARSKVRGSARSARLTAARLTAARLAAARERGRQAASAHRFAGRRQETGRRQERSDMSSKSREATRESSASAGGVLVESRLDGVKLVGRGKVRDLYDVGEHLLLVASDRLSAFDVVLPDGIPDKGKVLTRLSVFWFGLLNTPNHLVASKVADMPPQLAAFRDQLEDRAMLVRKLKIFPIECVVRGYLAGSGWSEYRERGSVCCVPLPKGLKESDRLPEPIFTPTTKAAAGHDLPMTFAEVEKTVGAARAAELRDKSISVYRQAADYARGKGIIICDTKFEWGIPQGAPAEPSKTPAVLADEVLTPDSSRFWPLDQYQPGRGQPSFDKQYVRDYLSSLKWNKQPPGPPLPAEVISHTTAKYREIFERLTGRPWK